MIDNDIVQHKGVVQRKGVVKAGLVLRIVGKDSEGNHISELLENGQVVGMIKLNNPTLKPIAGTYDVLLQKGEYTKIEGGYEFRRPFVKRHSDGRELSKSDRDLLESMPSVPPSWSPTHICLPNSQIVWVSKRNKELPEWSQQPSTYWTTQQESEKVQRLAHMDGAYWQLLSDQLKADIESPNKKQQMLATAVLTMQRCGFSGGWDSDKLALTSLKKRHYKDGAFILGENVCTIGNDGGLPRKLDPLLRQKLDEYVQGGDPSDKLFPFESKELQTYIRSFDLRNKDFRLYFSNFVLVDELSKVSATRAGLAEKRQAIAAAFHRGQESLMYANFLKMFMSDAEQFQEVVDRYAGIADNTERVSEILGALVNLMRDDWRDMVHKVPFTNVLIITDAGAESIDLKRVQDIVVMDPTWTRTKEDQIVGRGQRWKSHADLPREKQKVTVHRLFLDGPDGEELADRDIFGMAESKFEAEQETLQRLESAT